MYLKSPRRRREIFLIVKCIEKYFSVPKIASPEARKRNYIENVQSPSPRIQASCLGQGDCTKTLQNHSPRIRALSLVLGGGGGWWWLVVVVGGGGDGGGGGAGGGGRTRRRRRRRRSRVTVLKNRTSHKG